MYSIFPCSSSIRGIVSALLPVKPPYRMFVGDWCTLVSHLLTSAMLGSQPAATGERQPKEEVSRYTPIEDLRIGRMKTWITKWCNINASGILDHQQGRLVQRHALEGGKILLNEADSVRSWGVQDNATLPAALLGLYSGPAWLGQHCMNARDRTQLERSWKIIERSII